MKKNIILAMLVATSCSCTSPNKVSQTENVTITSPQSGELIFENVPINETVVLEFPENECKWREVSRFVSKDLCTVERIPENQEVNDWIDLIDIHFYKNDGKKRRNIEKILKSFHQVALDRYSQKKLTWKVLQKDKNTALYEWILHSYHNGIAPQHVIARVFVTGDGIHTISYDHQYTPLDQKERDKWVASFQKIQIQKLSQVKNSDQFMSLLPRKFSQEELVILENDLAPEGLILTFPKAMGQFKEDLKTFSDSSFIFQYIPIHEDFENATSLIQIFFKRGENLKNKSVVIDNSIEEVRSMIIDKFPQALSSFKIIQRSELEYIYEWIMPEDDGHPPKHLMSRVILTEQGMHIVVFTRNCNMTDEKERLERLEILQNNISIVSKEETLKPDQNNASSSLLERKPSIVL